MTTPQTLTAARGTAGCRDPLPPELHLDSFGPAVNAAVIGAGGGLGSAFAAALARSRNVAEVVAFSRRDPGASDARLRWQHLDLESEPSIERAAAREAGRGTVFHIVIVATGLLHEGTEVRPEKTWQNLEGASLEKLFRINSVGPALVAKHFLPLLARNRKTAFAALSARVGSIADNDLGGWYGYRASKAALNMVIRTLAIELKRRNPSALCLALHPGTVDTALSKPFQRAVPADRLFCPDRAATKLLGILDQASTEQSGQFLAWDGTSIPY